MERFPFVEESEEKLLIGLRLQREDRFLGVKSYDTLWGEIANEMKEMGIEVSILQILYKWKSLKKKLKDVNDENRKTGNSAQTWKYFKRFGEVYRSKVSTRVAVSFDTGRKTKLFLVMIVHHKLRRQFVVHHLLSRNLIKLSPRNGK